MTVTLWIITSLSRLSRQLLARLSSLSSVSTLNINLCLISYSFPVFHWCFCVHYLLFRWRVLLNKINGLERRTEADTEFHCHRSGSILPCYYHHDNQRWTHSPEQRMSLMSWLEASVCVMNQSTKTTTTALNVSFCCAAELLYPPLNGWKNSDFIFVLPRSSQQFHAQPSSTLHMFKCHCTGRCDDISLRSCRMTFGKTRSCSTSG